MTRETSDRRRAPRMDFRGAVQVLEEVRGEWSEAVSHDISRLGVFVVTQAPYRIGESVSVKFLLPTCAAQIEVAGRVVRRAEPIDPLAPSLSGVAIEFDEVEPWIGEELDRFLAGAGGGPGMVVSTRD